MTQSRRILIAILILILVIGAVLVIDALRRSRSTTTDEDQVTLAPGSIPIYVDGQLAAGFSPDDLDQLEQVSFVDAEEGKTQEGWLLRDVLLLYLKEDDLEAGTLVTVSSSSQNKAAQLSWAEVDEPANMVMFDLAGRGTLKLVSLLEKLGTRDQWVQDVDKIEVASSQ